MVDVKFWGPSGWKLLHAISFESNPEKQALFTVLGDVLPCKYCRKSTKMFIKQRPVTGDTAEWLYDLHNKVNHKLEMQHAKDPSVPRPMPSPSFSEVQMRYKNGLAPLDSYKDFLYSMAFNFDRKKHVVSSHKIFWNSLSAMIPEVFVPKMTNNRTYLEDVKEMMNDNTDVYSYVLKHKSHCKRKTCRKIHLRRKTLRSV
jgi:hypothetical protein